MRKHTSDEQVAFLRASCEVWTLLHRDSHDGFSSRVEQRCNAGSKGGNVKNEVRSMYPLIRSVLRHVFKYAECECVMSSRK